MRAALALLCLAVPPALVGVGADAEAFRPTKSPVSPDGVRATCDLPPDRHMRNTGGMGRGGPGTGYGLCVFTSVEVAARYQGVAEFDGFQKWMTTKPGGGSPSKLTAMIAQFCREKGVPEPAYVQHTGGDAAFLDLAIRTRRMVGVTYSGSDDFYGGPIDHMVDLVHLDPATACVVDNNRPGSFVWMTRAEFVQRWKARGGGWAVVLLQSPPPPPLPAAAWVEALAAPAPCVCGDACKCKAGRCPNRCPTARPQKQPCPTGRCPLVGPAAAEKFDAARWTDRSAASVYVRRDLGNGISECGTGSVVAARGGKSLVLTNAHVAEDGKRPLAVVAGGKTYAAKYLAGSRVDHLGPGRIDVKGPDLALLAVDAPLAAAPVADEPPAAGAAVCQWGYGGHLAGQGPTFKTGQTIDSRDHVEPVQRTTIPSQSGDSGAGVFDARGRLVAVCWGGTGGVEYAVRLDQVRAFLAAHTPAEFAAPEVEAEAAPPPHQNYGIDRDELEKLTDGGKQRYWVRDREASQRSAFDAVAGAGGLVDDSDRYHLSAVGGEAERKRLEAALADPRLAPYRDRLHVGCYAPDSWVARDRLRAALTLQEPAGRGGRVVGTLDRIDVELLLKLLQLAFDPPARPTPTPSAPDQTPPAVTPAPNPAPAAPAAPVDWKWLVLAALAALVVWLRRAKTLTPEK